MDAIRISVKDEPESGIMTPINYGFGRQGLIPLWSGEGSLPTPSFISEACNASLVRGDTFYTWQRGIPELRQALATYHQRLYRKDFSPENFFVTGGGMQSIQLAMQILTGEGDEVIIPTPAWPNYAAPLRLKGARPVEVPMTYAETGWSLDLDHLFDAVTERTKVIVLNTPSNPLGWVATLEDLVAIRDMARSRGLWIVADEVYSRFHFSAGGTSHLPPSFIDVCDMEERLIMANTFSKNWAMTGWRVGWMSAPKLLGDAIENLIQYNTSGTAAFMQHGCIKALEDGEEFLAQQIGLARANRDFVSGRLSEIGGIDFAMPEGAFYLFFKVEGMQDSMAASLRIIDEAGVGLAPGSAFGPGGEGFMRICLLRERHHTEEATDRLVRWFKNTWFGSRSGRA